jgi:hypothetical protein
MGTFRTKAETLLFLLPLLIESGPKRKALLDSIQKNSKDWVAIQDAMDAGRKAIELLSEERAKQLTVAECCVYMRRGEDQGSKLLRLEFRGGGRFKEGRDFRQIDPRKNEARKGETINGDRAKQGGNRKPYWVHWRKPLIAWWRDVEARDRRGKHKRKSKSVSIAERDVALEKVLADLAAHGLEDLAMARRKEFPWLTDTKGFVVDNLWLSGTADSTMANQLSVSTVQVEWLTLETVTTGRQWTSESARAPWLSVWLTLIDRERQALDALEMKTGYRLTGIRAAEMDRRLAARAGASLRKRS